MPRKSKAAQAPATKPLPQLAAAPSGNEGVSFWGDTGSDLLCVKPGSSPRDASDMAVMLINYAAERLVPAVEGTQDPKKSVRGDEAFMLRFLLTAAAALVESMPVEGHGHG